MVALCEAEAKLAKADEEADDDDLVASLMETFPHASTKVKLSGILKNGKTFGGKKK